MRRCCASAKGGKKYARTLGISTVKLVKRKVVVVSCQLGGGEELRRRVLKGWSVEEGTGFKNRLEMKKSFLFPGYFLKRKKGRRLVRCEGKSLV